MGVQELAQGTYGCTDVRLGGVLYEWGFWIERCVKGGENPEVVTEQFGPGSTEPEARTSEHSPRSLQRVARMGVTWRQMNATVYTCSPTTAPLCPNGEKIRRTIPRAMYTSADSVECAHVHHVHSSPFGSCSLPLVAARCLVARCSVLLVAALCKGFLT